MNPTRSLTRALQVGKCWTHPSTTDAPIFATTCELAQWCKERRELGWTRRDIARALSKSESYVNNLIRVVDRASPAVLLRWRQEQNGEVEAVCATDWLVQVCLLPHEEQDRELANRIATMVVVVPPVRPES